LKSVYQNSIVKPVFTVEYRNSSCPLSEKGKKIPKLIFGEPKPLGPDDNYRYDHALYEEIIYWLPVEFLP